jgi:HK97 family phage prohead protease
VIGPQRYPNGTEVRAAEEIRAASGRRLEGYAAVFNVPAQIMDFRETIKPGAFRASLASGADVVALVDHDPSQLLARTKSGTLHLAEDARGLAFDLAVPDTQLGRDIITMAERGDLGGASFGFRVTDEAWPSRGEREIRSVELAEISVVHSWPAYDQTTVNTRTRPHSAPLRLRLLLATL